MFSLKILVDKENLNNDAVFLENVTLAASSNTATTSSRISESQLILKDDKSITGGQKSNSLSVN